MPFLLLILGALFNIWNSYIQGRWIFRFVDPPYTVEWLYDIRFIFGFIIFQLGWVINYHSDRLLQNLRPSGEKSYKIPIGGLFTYISCANYFGEIVEWSGWAVMVWSMTGFAFPIFTIGNLLPRASTHHKWYKNHFDNYPKTRKALIPFIL